MHLLLLLPLALLALDVSAQLPARPATPAQGGRSVSGVEALRILSNQKQYPRVESTGFKLLWDDIRQPEILFLLADALEKQNKKEDAGACYTLFLRTLDEKSPPSLKSSKPIAERRLKNLGLDGETLLAKYAKSAKGKHFEGPEKVAEEWMNVIEGDLFNLHGLYAWPLVGPGRADAKPDWIHNKPGAKLHRSGMKYVPEVEGRKGVLFTVPLKEVGAKDADQSNQEGLKRLGHNSRAEIANPGGCRFLRVGTRAYGFPVDLRVIVAEKRLATERVNEKEWRDLKFELPDGAEKVRLEFIVPEGQKWSEGLWLDYVEFFDD